MSSKAWGGITLLCNCPIEATQQPCTRLAVTVTTHCTHDSDLAQCTHGSPVIVCVCVCMFVLELVPFAPWFNWKPRGTSLTLSNFVGVLLSPSTA